MKTILRELSPPLLWRAMSKLKPRPVPVEVRQYGFLGNYESFAAARIDSTGYPDAAITSAYLEGIGKIRGSSISTLDSLLLAAMQCAILKLERKVRVLDFGGGLGAQYFSLRRFISDQIERWTVVELSENVEAGNEMADDKLIFTTELQEADIVIASGSLQYTPTPYETLRALLKLATFSIFNRMPVFDRDRWTVQRIHPDLFGHEVSLPHFFFNRGILRKTFGLNSTESCAMEWKLPDGQAMIDGEVHDVFQGFLTNSCR
jgi:putative methyltransferase (TIGR04325 family)